MSINGGSYKSRRRGRNVYAERVDQLSEFVILVKALQREIERMMNDAMQPLGLTAQQADALYVVGRAGPLSLGELGAMLIAEAGNPSRLVDRLVKAGYIRRIEGGADRRRVELSLTSEGRAVAERVAAARAEVLRIGRELVGDRDVGPALEVMRDLVNRTSYGDIIARREPLET